MTLSPCPFCTPDSGRVFPKGQAVFALWGAFSVNKGHALIISYRHVRSCFDATPEEQEEILRTVTLVRERIEASHAPAGYNIGVNMGLAAGQTLDHLHVHVIPGPRTVATRPGTPGLLPLRSGGRETTGAQMAKLGRTGPQRRQVR